MRRYVGWGIITILILFLGLNLNRTAPKTVKKPETVYDLQSAEENPKFKEYKKAYLKELYRATPGTDVAAIRAKQLKERALIGRTPPNGATTQLNGKWYMRNLSNEAGDIQLVDYDPVTNSVYAMSTVGHIFRGSLDNTMWINVFDEMNCNTSVFQFVWSEYGGRYIASFGSGYDHARLKYTKFADNWMVAKGMDFIEWGGNKPIRLYEMSDGTLYYLVYCWIASSWDRGYELYKSTDDGATYTKIHKIEKFAGSNSDVTLWQYPGSDTLYMYDTYHQTRTVVQHNPIDHSTTISSPDSLKGAVFDDYTFQATGKVKGGVSRHYIFNKGNMFYSTDGINWVDKGAAKLNGNGSVSLWGKNRSFMANPNNDDLYGGGFQFIKTTHGNELDWKDQYSYWWKYYDRSLPNNKDSMHVDITGIRYFEKQNGDPFILVLNHAGIHVSYDNMKTTKNIGLINLNCVTLYDHATAADGTIYFGAQDKGTFSTDMNCNITVGAINTENQTTGDGMRELFFNNGKSYFGFLQNGFMICKTDKNVNGGYYSWQVPGNDIPGWINPVENHPDPASKKCYVAGGNLNGGDGSYLIQMEVSFNQDGSNFSWNPTQFNYDFKANSRSSKATGIKAIGVTPADHNRIYVASGDASFFYSKDGGTNWTLSAYQLPGMFMWDMAVSETNADSLFVCGTGWSNTGVYMSTDGGDNFTALSNQAPLATYYDIALSSDHKYLFAATSEGPYVYDLTSSSWFYMGDATTPLVEYRSVEYIKDKKIVRFGTYGRGLMDFHINDVITSTVELSSDLKLFPNPARNIISISGVKEGVSLQVLNLLGKQVLHQPYSNTINIGNLSKGSYLIRIVDRNGKQYISKFQKK